MGRKPCGLPIKKGAWTPLEDQILIDYININGEGKWSTVSKQTGLERGGKSCRLRWLNYLRPDIKRGNISDEEEELIIRLHKLLGNRWCLIAGRLPSRTDNEIKNYWNTTLRKKVNNDNKTCLLATQSSQPSSPRTTIAEAERRSDGGMTTTKNADYQMSEFCLSELLEIDVHEFNSIMRSAFGEDPLEESDHQQTNSSCVWEKEHSNSNA